MTIKLELTGSVVSQSSLLLKHSLLRTFPLVPFESSGVQYNELTPNYKPLLRTTVTQQQQINKKSVDLLSTCKFISRHLSIRNVPDFSNCSFQNLQYADKSLRTHCSFNPTQTLIGAVLTREQEVVQQYSK